ncbi:MAG: DUF169 domain-containing protein [Methanocellales archaeon]
MTVNYREMSNKFRKFFELPFSPVAVKILKREEKSNVNAPKRYCEMVKISAAAGEEYIFGLADLSCANAEITLGFTAPEYVEIYPRLETGTKAVKLAPLEKCSFEPDVILIISTPSKIMRIAIALSRLRNRMLNAKFKGEFAVCGECTAIPIAEQQMNISLLCGGARIFGGFKADELAMGLPFGEFKELVLSLREKNITSALCGCLIDDLPRNAIEELEKIGFHKATDHFFGRFNGEIVRLYASKDERGKITAITLHIPVKIAEEEKMQKSLESLQSPFLYQRRENWIDLALPIELGESLSRAAMKSEKFKTILSQNIDLILKEAKKLRF